MAKLIMLKFLCIPAFFSIALFLLTGFAVAGKPKTFGIKTGKSLFDIKNKVLPETMVSNALDPIGLDVKVVPHKDEEKVLDVKGISSLDRSGSFFKDKNKGVRSAKETAKELYKAIEVGELEDAKRLQIGLDINFQDRNGITPLYLSVFYNRPKLVIYFLLNNADINLADNDGLAPLHVAGLENLPKMVGLLLDNGAEINASDRDGYTPLHIAIDQNSFNAANELLAAGAKVNSRAEWKHTPLHTSVATGNIKIVEKMLIEADK